MVVELGDCNIKLCHSRGCPDDTPHWRRVPGFPVYGVGQPSEAGFSKISEKVAKEKMAGNKDRKREKGSKKLPQMTKISAKKAVLSKSKLIVYISSPKKVFELDPSPNNSPYGPQKEYKRPQFGLK